MVAPLIAAAGISAATSLLGGIAGGKGAKKAAKVTAAAARDIQASNERINTQNNVLAANIYDQNKSILSPYVDRGNVAGGQINALLGLGTGDATQGALSAYNVFRDSAGYQAQQQAANNAVNTGYAARGALESGAAQKALQKNASVLAGGYFNSYLGALQGQQQTGLSGASALAGVGQNYVGQVSSNNTNTANSNNAVAAGAATQQGNAALSASAGWQSVLGGVANAAGLYAGNSMYGSSYGGSVLTNPSLFPKTGVLSGWGK